MAAFAIFLGAKLYSSTKSAGSPPTPNSFPWATGQAPRLIAALGFCGRDTLSSGNAKGGIISATCMKSAPARCILSCYVVLCGISEIIFIDQ